MKPPPPLRGPEPCRWIHGQGQDRGLTFRREPWAQSTHHYAPPRPARPSEDMTADQAFRELLEAGFQLWTPKRRLTLSHFEAGVRFPAWHVHEAARRRDLPAFLDATLDRVRASLAGEPGDGPEQRHERQT